MQVIIENEHGCGQNAITTGANAADSVNTPGAPNISTVADLDVCALSGVSITVELAKRRLRFRP